MRFKDYLENSEKTLSGKFVYDEKDIGENTLRGSVEDSIRSLQTLDKFKKHKFYGKELDSSLKPKKIQTTVSEFSRDDEAEKILHAMIGIATESGELLEAIYKSKWGGQNFDKTNLKEELGDLFWYMAILFREFEFDLEDVLQININKLRARYGEKFSQEGAINRNLDKEREILEGTAGPTKKVAINASYGSFHLSGEALKRLYDMGSPIVESTSIKDYCLEDLSVEQFIEMNMHNPFDVGGFLSDTSSILFDPKNKLIYELKYGDEFRSHPDLIKVIEEFGIEKASGNGSQIKVVEIPLDADHEVIEDETGYEYVAEKHRVWF